MIAVSLRETHLLDKSKLVFFSEASLFVKSMIMLCIGVWFFLTVYSTSAASVPFKVGVVVFAFGAAGIVGAKQRVRFNFDTCTLEIRKRLFFLKRDAATPIARGSSIVTQKAGAEHRLGIQCPGHEPKYVLFSADADKTRHWQTMLERELADAGLDVI